MELKEKIFAAYFTSNWGWLRAFSSSLPQQINESLQPTRSLTGTYEGGRSQGPATLSFISAKDGRIDSGWLGFMVGTNAMYLPFQGNYLCNGDDCKLEGSASENIPVWATAPYFRKNDRLLLSGTVPGNLQGSLQPAAREVFKATDPAGQTEVQYTWKFRTN